MCVLTTCSGDSRLPHVPCCDLLQSALSGVQEQVASCIKLEIPGYGFVCLFVFPTGKCTFDEISSF